MAFCCRIAGRREAILVYVVCGMQLKEAWRDLHMNDRTVIWASWSELYDSRKCGARRQKHSSTRLQTSVGSCVSRASCASFFAPAAEQNALWEPQSRHVACTRLQPGFSFPSSQGFFVLVCCLRTLEVKHRRAAGVSAEPSPTSTAHTGRSHSRPLHSQRAGKVAASGPFRRALLFAI